MVSLTVSFLIDCLVTGCALYTSCGFYCLRLNALAHSGALLATAGHCHCVRGALNARVWEKDVCYVLVCCCNFVPFQMFSVTHG